jgi:hypothetical protein
MSFEYEKEIHIDETALDVEWLDQPSLMLKYCRAAAEAKRNLDLCKEALDVAKAQLDQKIRMDAERHQQRMTETSIQNAILNNEDYQRRSVEHIDAKYEHDLIQSTVRAFEHRKSALENLVRLHGMAYFAGPSAPRNLTEARNVSAKVRLAVAIRRQRE